MDWLVRDRPVIEALNGLVKGFPRDGFWKYVRVLLLRDCPWNHKRLHRVYCALGLNQPRSTNRRLLERDPTPLVVPQRHKQVWSADFMSNALYRGTRYRLFNMNDDFNRESVTIEIDTLIRCERLVWVFERLMAEHGLPDMQQVDNGLEFMDQVLADWCQANGVFIDYIEPGKAEPKCFYQHFNRSLRNELLDLYLFLNLAEIREIVSQWRKQHNEDRPHDTLGGLPPVIYAQCNLENPTFELPT